MDSRDIKKHRNDILRIASLMPLAPCNLPGKIRNDMENFLQKLKITKEELNNLHLEVIQEDDVIKLLKGTFGL